MHYRNNIKILFDLRNLHLTISVVIVALVAIIYGFLPNLLFDVTVITPDENSIFKALMGLYFSFATLWVLGLFNKKYWQMATLTNFLFMFGLAFGRIVSLCLDGFPSPVFLFGTIGELTLGCYALYQLNNHKIK
ncbi:DUF4345 domain-containing protein [Flavobacterium sp.]|uniref:DUF4345 domain-containing protein n=1 Tax=Flavobacterium sp. TaxID=239 RepID=UPI0026186815|nr:DUF4345 domain-containing protein [Flavobacterium sp.]